MGEASGLLHRDHHLWRPAAGAAVTRSGPSDPEVGLAHRLLRFIRTTQRDSGNLSPSVEEQHELLGTAAENRARLPSTSDDPRSVGPLELESHAPDLTGEHPGHPTQSGPEG